MLAFEVAHRQGPGLAGSRRQEQAPRKALESGDGPFAIRRERVGPAFAEAHGRRAIGPAQVRVRKEGRPRDTATIAEEHRVPVPGKRGQRGPLEPGEVPLPTLAWSRHDEAVVLLTHRDEDAAILGNV